MVVEAAHNTARARRRLRSAARPSYVAGKVLAFSIRRAYRARFAAVADAAPDGPPTLPASVYSLSSEGHLPEQVASLVSLLTCVGVPQSFTVVSDGSYTPASVALLERVHRCVSVVDHRDFVSRDLPDAVRRYADSHAFGKKLAVELSIPVAGPTLYADDDVLYFPAAAGALRDLMDRGQLGEPSYLPDCDDVFLDRRMLDDPAEAEAPVNGGFMVLGRPLDWTSALTRIERLGNETGYFSEQTALHLAMHASGGLPLDPRRFVLTGDDRWALRDRYVSGEVALRHYVLPTRFKFWLQVGRSRLRPPGCGAWPRRGAAPPRPRPGDRA
jgi:hypothetical protein